MKEVIIDESKLEGLFPFPERSSKVAGIKKWYWIDCRYEMGLGKTIEVIGYTNIHQEKYPILVICPASVKMNWEAERIEKWAYNKT